MTQTEILAAHLWLTDEEITLLASKIWADHQISVHPDTLRIGADAATEQARMFYEAEIADKNRLIGELMVNLEATEMYDKAKAIWLVAVVQAIHDTLPFNAKELATTVEAALEHWQKWVNG